MLIFALIIVLSIVLWMYYKVSILKTKDGLKQRYFNAKSRLCLGSFIIAFAINQYLAYETQLSLLIGILFIVLGGLQLVRGWKETKHYRGEWKRLNPAK